jgi:hypothetical protein
MEDNKMLRLAEETREKIKSVFGDRITEPKIVDVVEYPQYRAFRLEFIAYDYFFMMFNYEADFCGFTISIGNRLGADLNDGDKPTFYSEIRDWDKYLKELMIEVESRIPDKFLKAKGWYKRRGILQCLKMKWIF